VPRLLYPLALLGLFLTISSHRLKSSFHIIFLEYEAIKKAMIIRRRINKKVLLLPLFLCLLKSLDADCIAVSEASDFFFSFEDLACIKYISI